MSIAGQGDLRHASSTQRGVVVGIAALVVGLVLIATAVASGQGVVEVSVGVGVAVVAVVARRWLLAWPSLLGVTVLVILFVPIRRYSLPGDLPFELEPYRLLIGAILLAWAASLLADPGTRLRATGFEGPIGLIALGVVGSIATNPGRVTDLSAEVVKASAFLLSFLLLVFFTVSVVRRFSSVVRLLGILVLGGAVVAAFAAIESRTGNNAFNGLARFLPGIELTELPEQQTRGGRVRAFASAQHAIPLGAALAMLTPIALVFAVRDQGRRWLWSVAGAAIVVGAVATTSRTAVVMLSAVVVTLAFVRPRLAKLLVPALVPVLLVVYAVLPGAIGSLRKSFSPEGGLLAEQSTEVTTRGSGRLADLGPSLAEWAQSPLFGQGFGTRVIELGRENALILDNQWLTTLLEIGAVGFIGWVWLIGAAVVSAGREARRDASDRGWVLAALTASIAAFGVGMLTFDAFGFVQVTFIFFLLLALTAVLLRGTPESLRMGRGILSTGGLEVGDPPPPAPHSANVPRPGAGVAAGDRG